MALLPKFRVLEEKAPAIQWTPLERLEISGKKGVIQFRGKAFNIAFDDTLDLVHALEKAGLAGGARMLPARMRSAIVAREKLWLEKVIANNERGKLPPQAVKGSEVPQGLEENFYFGVWGRDEIFEHWVFYVEDLYIVTHRMNRLMQGLHPRGAAAAVHAAFHAQRGPIVLPGPTKH